MKLLMKLLMDASHTCGDSLQTRLHSDVTSVAIFSPDFKLTALKRPAAACVAKLIYASAPRQARFPFSPPFIYMHKCLPSQHLHQNTAHQWQPLCYDLQ